MFNHRGHTFTEEMMPRTALKLYGRLEALRIDKDRAVRRLTDIQNAASGLENQIAEELDNYLLEISQQQKQQAGAAAEETGQSQTEAGSEDGTEAGEEETPESPRPH